jgi:hypothetical protein
MQVYVLPVYRDHLMSVDKKKIVAGQFSVKYKLETNYWTQKLNRQDYGVGKYWVLLAVVKE